MKNSIKSKNIKRKSTINSESRTARNFALKTVLNSTQQTANTVVKNSRKNNEQIDCLLFSLVSHQYLSYFVNFAHCLFLLVFKAKG